VVVRPGRRGHFRCLPVLLPLLLQDEDDPGLKLQRSAASRLWGATEILLAPHGLLLRFAPEDHRREILIPLLDLTGRVLECLLRVYKFLGSV
jgi:hypothetical protein